MNQGTAHRHHERHSMSHAKQVAECKARLDAIEERRRLRIASTVSHGTSPAESPPPKVQPSAVSDSTAAPSADPPGPPDSPGDSAPGTPSQPAVDLLPALPRWRLLTDSQGEWRDISIHGHRFSILKTEFEPRVFEYLTFVDGVDTGEFPKVRDAFAELQRRAREILA
jgi:hypothetical protein